MTPMKLDEALAVLRYLDGSFYLASEARKIAEVRQIAEQVVRESAEEVISRYAEKAQRMPEPQDED